jgi:hypothetical protein
LVFTCYAAEVTERDLPTVTFPKTARAVAASLASIEQCNGAILAVIGKRRALH